MTISKWRIVLVNATIPAAAFYTIQKEDMNVFEYSHQFSTFVETIVKKHDIVLSLGEIGDAYSDWQYIPLNINDYHE